MRRCFVLVILCMFLVGTLLFSSLDMVIPVPRNNERQTSYPKEEKPLSDEIRVGSREEKTDSHTFGGSWFQSRDTDFLECTLDDVQVVGHGPEARVDLAKKRSPGWQNMDPEVSPSGRYGHAMACNSIEGRVVLFGGYDRAYDSETWCYDTARNTWKQMSPSPSPSGRYHHKMTYDSKNNKVVLFGGYSSKSDTWLYDVENDIWTNPSPDPHPPTLYQHAMAYDSINDKVVLFGGRHNSGGWREMNETWIYDTALNQWTRKDPPISPPARRAHGLTYFPAYNKVVLFGGYDGSSYINDTWVYDVSTNRWTEIHPNDSPPIKGYPGMVYDSEIHGIVVYGGLPYEANVWQFDPYENTWTTKTFVPQPTNRYAHAMAYDQRNSKSVMFGGYPSYKDDTWTYDTTRYSTSGKITSPVITLPEGFMWDQASIDKFERPGTYINVTVLDALTSSPIPGFGTISGYNFNISSLNTEGITAIRLRGSFTGSMDISPTLRSWGVQWNKGGGLYDEFIGDNNLAGPHYADNDTVGLWQFNEAAGQTAYDISGSGNDGVLGGGSNVEPSDPGWIESKFDNGLRFDGKDDYVWIENSESLKPDDILSIEVWFKMDGSRKRTMALLGTRADSDYAIQILANGTVRALLSTIDKNPDEYNEIYSRTVIQQGLWYHVALTFHQPDLVLYINGMEEARFSADFPIRHSNVPLFVGAEVGSPHFPYEPLNHFYGIIDSIRISNISRDPGEILLNARGGLSLENGYGQIALNTPLPNPDTVILYSFEDDDINAIRDRGPNNIPGQLHGTRKVTSGKFGSALEFNGVDHHIRVGDSSLMHLSGVTYQFWMKCYEANNQRILLYEEKEDSNGMNELAAIDAVGLVHYSFDNGTYDIVSEKTLPMDEWVHLALVRADDSAVIYINGEESARGGFSGFESENTKPLLIGGNGSNINGFAGILDEVIILDRALSSDIVASHADLHERQAAFRTKGISLPGWSAEIPDNIWDTFHMNCEVPEGTNINVIIRDNSSGEILIETAANSSSISADLKGINVKEHSSVNIEFLLGSDGADSPSILNYRINWSEVESPVQIHSISDEIFLTEDVPRKAIMDLSEFFHDEYSGIINSTYTLDHISEPGNVNLSLNGSILDANSLSENWTGTVKVAVGCTNLYGRSQTSNQFGITVANIDDRPVWLEAPPPVMLDEDGNITLRDYLSGHVYDAEGNSLIFEVDCDNENIMVELQEPDTLGIRGTEDYYGTGTITATVLQKLDTTLNASIGIPVTIRPVDDPPKVVLMGPTKHSVHRTRNIDFAWEVFDVDNEVGNITFDFYLSKVFPPLMYLSDIEERLVPIKNLEDDSTYFWKVIPRHGEIMGSCLNGTWSFNINTTVLFPRSNLVAPLNGSILNVTEVNLTWEGVNPTMDDMIYQVYLGTSPKNITKKATTGNTWYQLEDMEDNTTYYWRIIPVAGAVEGTCLSGTWSFQLNRSFETRYGLQFMLEKRYFNVSQGENITINITLTNLGNVPVTALVEFSGRLSTYVEVHEENVFLPVGASKTIGATLSDTDILLSGQYELTVRIIHPGGIEEGQILVTLAPESKVNDGGESVLWYGIGAAAVIFLILGMIIFVIRRKRDEKRRKEFEIEMDALEATVVLPTPPPPAELPPMKSYPALPQYGMGYGSGMDNVPQLAQQRYAPTAGGDAQKQLPAAEGFGAQGSAVEYIPPPPPEEKRESVPAPSFMVPDLDSIRSAPAMGILPPAPSDREQGGGIFRTPTSMSVPPAPTQDAMEGGGDGGMPVPPVEKSQNASPSVMKN